MAHSIFAERLKATRIELCLNREELEVSCSLPKGVCAQYEGGYREPSLVNLRKIKQGLGIDWARLLD